MAGKSLQEILLQSRPESKVLQGVEQLAKKLGFMVIERQDGTTLVVSYGDIEYEPGRRSYYAIKLPLVYHWGLEQVNGLYVWVAYLAHAGSEQKGEATDPMQELCLHIMLPNSIVIDFPEPVVTFSIPEWFLESDPNIGTLTVHLALRNAMERFAAHVAQQNEQFRRIAEDNEIRLVVRGQLIETLVDYRCPDCESPMTSGIKDPWVGVADDYYSVPPHCSNPLCRYETDGGDADPYQHCL